MLSLQEEFLIRAARDARAAGHLFPAYAACEAALESGWGQSRLTVEANNLFGQKQAHPPLRGTATLVMPTREFLHGAWIAVQASWVRFPDWEASFRERMALLRSLAEAWPNYRRALAAPSGEQFITEVSRTWSTDPHRAGKVLEVYDCHRAALAQALAETRPQGREVAGPEANSEATAQEVTGPGLSRPSAAPVSVQPPAASPSLA